MHASFPVALATVAPPAETNPATAAVGVSANAAHGDHLHAVATPATPVTQALADAAATGAGVGFAADTHKHGMPVGGLSNYGALTADQPFTSNTTLANLPGMAYAIAANEKVVLVADVYVTMGAGGFKFDVTGPAAPSKVRILGISIDEGAGNLAARVVTAFSTAMAFGGLTSTDAVVHLVIEVENGANAGTLQLRGAQAASSLNVTTFVAPSPLYGWRAA